mgnify:CR=1 FL=1
MTQHHEGDDVQVVKVRGGVPMAWLLGALWAVTMALGGAYGASLKAQVERIPAQAEKLAAIEQRVTRIEGSDSHQVNDRDLSEVLKRLDRLEGKVDDLRERQPTAARR